MPVRTYVCGTLGHKDTKRTLHYHIDDNRKKFIKDVRQELGENFSPNYIGQNNLENLTYNQGKAVYLSESGLYQLIAHVRDFRELVYRVILPDIGRDLMADILPIRLRS